MECTVSLYIKWFIPPPLRLSGSLPAQGSMTVKRHSEWAALSRPAIIRDFCVSSRTPALRYSAAECTDEPQKHQICPDSHLPAAQTRFYLLYTKCMNKLMLMLCSHYAEITVIWLNTVHVFVFVCQQRGKRIDVVTVKSILLSVLTQSCMDWLWVICIALNIAIETECQDMNGAE